MTFNVYYYYAILLFIIMTKYLYIYFSFTTQFVRATVNLRDYGMHIFNRKI